MSHQGVLSTKQQEAAFLKILKKQCNFTCADCSSKSPTWASLDFGVFVCYNCSGQHRALGQNITRVRSTKLDCWTQENVDLMDALGNDQNEYWENRLQKQQNPTFCFSRRNQTLCSRKVCKKNLGKIGSG